MKKVFEVYTIFSSERSLRKKPFMYANKEWHK